MGGETDRQRQKERVNERKRQKQTETDRRTDRQRQRLQHAQADPLNTRVHANFYNLMSLVQCPIQAQHAHLILPSF